MSDDDDLLDLQNELDELERTDPKVRAAAHNYEKVVRELNASFGSDESAQTVLDTLVDDLDNQRINHGYTYSWERSYTERFMLDGGGPTAYANFVLSTDRRDIEIAFIEFIDDSGTQILEIPNLDGEATRLLHMLRGCQ